MIRMKFEIEIPDEKIEAEVFRLVTQELADKIFSEVCNYHERVFRREMKETLRDLLRERADEIIDRCIPYTAEYIGKKGVKKLVDTLGKGSGEG